MVLGDPVSGKDFFDRNLEKGILYSSLEDFEKGQKRNVAIIGLRKIGKTSLIKQFITTLHKNKPRLVCLDIYLPEQNVQNFFRNCIGAVIIELLRLMNFKPKTNTLTLDEAIKIIEQEYPRTTLAINNLISFNSTNKNEEAFVYLFSLLETLKKETNTLIIVFLDEFQRLQEYSRNISAPIDTFREKIMNQKEIWYIISGSAVGMLNKLIASTKSPLYAHFKILPLRGFSYKDSYEFVRKKKGDDFRLGDENISFLYEITNGNPFYLDIFINSIKNYCKFNKCRVSNDVLEDVLISEIFKSEGSIYSYFNLLVEQSLEKSGSRYYTEILKSIASEKIRPSQIARYIKISLTTLPSYLKKLQELELIRKIESDSKSRVSEYEITDTLFELWIKQVYELRQDPLIRDINIKMKIFKTNISKIISDYNSELGKGNESRIRELFRIFDNENFSGLVIPKFDKVERKDIDGVEIDVFSTIGKDVWIAEVTKQNIDTAEIENIKSKSDLVKSKFNLKEVIIISTKEIEKDAIDRCKKYKFKVWTIEDINKMLKKKKMFRILI